MQNYGPLINIRQLNIEYRMSPSASLPPFARRTRRINIHGMESGYQFIATLICALARQQASKGSHEINNDII